MVRGANVTELVATALFADVPVEVLTTLAEASSGKRLARKQILFSEGEPADHLYLVRSGRLKVVVESPQGDELILTVVGAGDVLGELSVLDGQPRSAAAQALESTELIALPVDRVRAVLLACPDALLAAAGELATNLRRLTGATADLVFLDLPRRLAKLILASHDGHQTELGLTQSEIASLLGVTRQSLNRALVALQRRGWIEAHAGRLLIKDSAALARFASS